MGDSLRTGKLSTYLLTCLHTVLYLVGVDVQLRQVRIKQQLRGVYADR